VTGCPRVTLSVKVGDQQRPNLLWQPRDRHAFRAIVSATTRKIPRRKATT
jgi:hypothetical protein